MKMFESFKISNFRMLKKCCATLKETSIDNAEGKSSIEYMTSSPINVINFDEVKKNYTNNLGMSEEFAKSVDAIAVSKDGQYLYFIEFKNGKKENIKSYEIRQKIYDSLLIFLDIITQGENDDWHINDTRKRAEFILVYNKDKNLQNNPLGYIKERTAEKGGKEFLNFGLGKFSPIYFKKVHTYSKQEFEDFISKNLS